MHRQTNKPIGSQTNKYTHKTNIQTNKQILHQKTLHYQMQSQSNRQTKDKKIDKHTVKQSKASKLNVQKKNNQ